ncbi:hypothetical protein B5F76_05100 [Desulfovibrio sp. An276]|nr:hypothetical protein B5F76_05100 [Desulfovibrio sp. An276]
MCFARGFCGKDLPILLRGKWGSASREPSFSRQDCPKKQEKTRAAQNCHMGSLGVPGPVLLGRKIFPPACLGPRERRLKPASGK